MCAPSSIGCCIRQNSAEVFGKLAEFAKFLGGLLGFRRFCEMLFLTRGALRKRELVVAEAVVRGIIDRCCDAASHGLVSRSQCIDGGLVTLIRVFLMVRW